MLQFHAPNLGSSGRDSVDACLRERSGSLGADAKTIAARPLRSSALLGRSLGR